MTVISAIKRYALRFALSRGRIALTPNAGGGAPVVPPVSDFTVSDSYAYDNQPVYFTSTSIGFQITQYEWEFFNGSGWIFFSAAANPDENWSTFYPSVGANPVNIRLTVANSAGSDTKTVPACITLGIQETTPTEFNDATSVRPFYTRGTSTTITCIGRGASGVGTTGGGGGEVAITSITPSQFTLLLGFSDGNIRVSDDVSDICYANNGFAEFGGLGGIGDDIYSGGNGGSVFGGGGGAGGTNGGDGSNEPFAEYGGVGGTGTKDGGDGGAGSVLLEGNPGISPGGGGGGGLGVGGFGGDWLIRYEWTI